MEDSFFFNVIHTEEISSEVNAIKFFNGDFESVIETLPKYNMMNVFTERSVIRANVLIASDRFCNRYNNAQMFRFKEKIRDFIHLMGDYYCSEDTLFSLSAFANNAIIVKFKKRSDISLTIFDNYIDDSHLDFEEAFLSFDKDNKKRLEYNTLPQIVEILKKI